ncbi:DUF4174 domain-containing protein [Nostoc edaphicum CCNP1411]|uniref:DUF4174 domain-containing protein n=1 Tax=Nostoc edaphicum CCNP1411 TaxID=1472755 RepID=A0A7D7Q9E2_9NOSO|nr:DUF4174 domain-containing protein [Nostoc edaphicum]QMS87417.1 DUF4174 domain-containing protein [Nostoc edaphicum CCNP1411]
MNNSALIAINLLVCIVLSPVSKADIIQHSTNHAIKMSSFNLSHQKWKNRVLLVFAPSIDNHTYQQQMQLLQEHNSGFADRDLVLVQVLSTDESYANKQPIDESSAAKLRDRFEVDKESFRVILVGKDGGMKRSYAKPVQATAIFEEIDAMPMRQQEMQEQGRQ